MVGSFDFSSIPKILFGKGKLDLLPGLIQKYGKKVLLITGKSSLKSQGKLDFLCRELKNSGIKYHNNVINKEPSPENVDYIVNQNKNNSIDVVVAVGGGSVIDAGKAVSAMLLINEPIKWYLEGVGEKEHKGIKVPFIAIPTTSGTGSESTKNAVISEVGGKGFKKSLRHDNFVPDIAIVDPELTISCPPEITAYSGLDAFTQLLESYVSTKANNLSDSMAIEGLRCIKNSFYKTCKNGNNIEARTDMSYAAFISGITLANAGLGVVHGFASSVGGYFNIAHGIVCGTLMGIANRINIDKMIAEDPANIAVKKYVNVGKIFAKAQNKEDSYYLNSFLDVVDEWIEKLKIPRLGKFGIKEGHLEKIVLKTSNKNNPVQLEKEDLMEILKNRL